MKKTLKSIQKKHGMLNEAYAWERTSGGALPTLADVQAKYNAKSVNEQEVTSKGAITADVGAAVDNIMTLLKDAAKTIQTSNDPATKQKTGKKVADALKNIIPTFEELGKYADFGSKL